MTGKVRVFIAEPLTLDSNGERHIRRSLAKRFALAPTRVRATVFLQIGRFDGEHTVGQHVRRVFAGQQVPIAALRERFVLED